MTLDAKAFNEMRAKFNERVRRYAISAGAHAAFTLANFIAFDLLRPTKQSNFISQEELAKAVNMGIRTVQRLLAELVPLGLVVEPGNGRGKASVYRIGPAKGVTDGTLSQVGNHATGDTLSDEKGAIERQERAPSDDKKGVTGDAPLTRKIQEERGKKRERAQVRAALSQPAEDFQNLDGKEGEIIQPRKRTRRSLRRAANGTALNLDWQPSDEDLSFAAESLTPDVVKRETQSYRDFGHTLSGMTYRKWITRAIEHEQGKPNAQPEGLGLGAFMRGLEGALSAKKVPP